MSKKGKLKKNSVRPLSPPVVSETFSIHRILIELVFDEIKYRLKGLRVSSSAIEATVCAKNVARIEYFFGKGMRRVNAVNVPSGGIGWTLEYPS